MVDSNETPQQETALVPIRGALAAFAPDPEIVKQLAGQFVMTLTYRGAKDLTYQDRIALAAASLAYGLSPALGEIWLLHDQGMFVGIAGWVKKMNEYAEKHGFEWRGNEIRLYKQDFAENDIPEDAQCAYKYIIRRQDLDDAYSKRVIDLVKAGLSYDQCKEILGVPPQVTGIGWIGKNETINTDKKGASMSAGQKAIKRAMKDALAKLVHLPFAGEGDKLNGGVVDTEQIFVTRLDSNEPSEQEPSNHDDAIDGEVVAQTQKPASAPQEPPPSELDEHLGPRMDLSRPWLPGMLQRQIELKVTKKGWNTPITADQKTKLLLNLNTLFQDELEPDVFRHTLTQFLVNKIHLADFTKGEASVLIDWSESEHAREEARLVIREDALAQGQTELFGTEPQAKQAAA